MDKKSNPNLMARRTKIIKLWVLDKFLGYPWTCDIGLLILMGLIQRYIRFGHPLETAFNPDNIISSLTSAMVSTLGFILASLTVIVTVKSSTKPMRTEESTNAQELILNSKNYPRIVRVFKTAIVELFLFAILTYICWTPFVPMTSFMKGFVATGGILILFTTISRSLFVLFNIISAEFSSK